MWSTTTFEKKMKQIFIANLGQEEGDKLYTQYSSARDELISEGIFDHIRSAEPNLSDHGEKHIKNVLENVNKLLGENIEELSVMTLYCLALSVLFHDVGNIKGRDNHNEKIASVYNHIRGGKSRYHQERFIIMQVGGAHTGKTKSGSRDTLKSLDRTTHLTGEIVNLRDIAALLRFADELAEGTQRTCQFMIENELFSDPSVIYHEYAQSVAIVIDKGNERIVLTFHIELNGKQKDDLQELLEFIYTRIIKVDEERRYNKHYCHLLDRFKLTSVTFNFYYNGSPVSYNINSIELPDRFPIPGESGQGKEELNQSFDLVDIEDLWKIVKEERYEEE
jgi:hypothetical protein